METTSSMSFELGKPFDIDVEELMDGIGFCVREDPTTLIFQCLVPSKKWRIETKVVFKEDSILADAINVSGNQEETLTIEATRLQYEVTSLDEDFGH